MNFPTVENILHYRRIFTHFQWHFSALIVTIGLGLLTLTPSIWFWGGVVVLAAVLHWMYERYVKLDELVRDDLLEFYEEIEEEYLEGLDYRSLEDQRFEYKSSISDYPQLLAYREVLKRQDAYVEALQGFFQPYEALPRFRYEVSIPKPYVVDGVFDQSRFLWQLSSFQLWESEYPRLWENMTPENRALWRAAAVAGDNLDCPYFSIILNMPSWYAFILSQPQ